MALAPIVARIRGADAWAHRRTGKRDILIYLAVYGIYEVARFLSIPGRSEAVRNAHRLMAVESDLGLNFERQFQAALSGGYLPQLFNYLYLAAQEFVIPVVLIYLFWKGPEKVYRRFRDTVIFTWILAIPMYMIFPVAPPRLAGIGIVDTVSRYSVVPLNSRMATSLFDPYASMPSLHAGLAVAVSVALVFSLRHRVTRFIAALWGPLMCVVVIATGNHFVVDVIAGIACATAGLGFAMAVEYGVADLRLKARAWAPVGLEIGMRPLVVASSELEQLRLTARQMVNPSPAGHHQMSGGGSHPRS